VGGNDEKEKCTVPKSKKKAVRWDPHLNFDKKYEANQRSRSHDLTEGKERPNQINSSKNG
jgi:hypothetical protein